MKIKLYPAGYQPASNDYLCKLCGWQGYPEIGEYGWCPTSKIMCPKCGPDALIEKDAE
jgi:hypothetical protein